jgi:hypothetical protein
MSGQARTGKCSELFSNADMGRNWSLRRGVVTSTKLKCQLQLLYAKMAPNGLDLGLRDKKKVNKRRETDSKRGGKGTQNSELRAHLRAALYSIPS